ncbi:T9SS type A sorting domain-containing protein [candidate division WOR-3 bacterium]|nr:T9SS type A sorting domain-containing protein [candidate division WOR-3 bacterium]
MTLDKKNSILFKTMERIFAHLKFAVTFFLIFVISQQFLHGLTPQKDSLIIQPIGSWPFGPPCQSVAINSVDDLAYFGVAAGVYILDISNPNNPTKVSERIHMKHFVRDLCYENNMLYGAVGKAGIEIWNVSTPTSPQYLSSHDTPGDTRKIQKLGSYAYIADGDSGLRIIDVSNPLNPYEVGFYNPGGFIGNLDVINDYAFLCDFNYGIRIVNITNPTNPVEVSNLPGSYYRGVAIQDNYMYIAVWTYAKGVDIADISNIANPHIVGSCDTSACFEIIIVDTFAYTVADMHGIYVIDVSDVTNPTKIGNYSDLCLMNNLVFHNAYLFVPDMEQFIDMSSILLILDVSNPANPQPIGSFPTPCYSMANAVDGNYVYIANHLGGLRIISISNPEMPEQISEYSGIWLSVDDVEIYWGYAIYAVLATWDGLEIVDINDPTNPQMVGSCGEWLCGIAVDIVTDYYPYAYLLCPHKLYAIDISVPNNPVIRDSCTITGLGKDLFCPYPWQYLYVAENYYGLRIYDRYYMSEVGYYDTPGTANGVFVTNDLAYVADGDAGLRIVDVTDPTNPQEIGFCDTPDTADKIVVSGSYAYIADGDSGFCVIDISDPANPYEITRYNTIGKAKDIAVRGDTIFLISYSAGLYLYEMVPASFKEEEVNTYLKNTLTVPNIILNNNLSINFTLTQKQTLSIMLYNLLGQKVKLFINETLNKGQYAYSFPIYGINTGVYFVVVSTKDTCISRKIIIINN